MTGRLFAAALVLGAAFLPQAAGAQALSRGECRIPAAEQARLLALPYAAFDQDGAGGWRPWFEAGCLADTAALIEAWIAAQPDIAEAEPELHFHAAQVHAFRGDYAAARAHLAHSLYPDRPSARPSEWNAYVRATDAFLARDRATLEEIYAEMGGGPPPPPRSLFDPPPARRHRMANLDIVEGLRACFDRPYREAYGAECRARR